MIRLPPRSTRTYTLFPYRRSSYLSVVFDPAVASPGAIVSAVEALGYHAHEREALATTDGEDRERAARRAEIRDLPRRVVFGAVLTLPLAGAVLALALFGAVMLPDVLIVRGVPLVCIAPGIADTR